MEQYFQDVWNASEDVKANFVEKFWPWTSQKDRSVCEILDANTSPFNISIVGIIRKLIEHQNNEEHIWTVACKKSFQDYKASYSQELLPFPDHIENPAPKLDESTNKQNLTNQNDQPQHTTPEKKGKSPSPEKSKQTNHKPKKAIVDSTTTHAPDNTISINSSKHAPNYNKQNKPINSIPSSIPNPSEPMDTNEHGDQCYTTDHDSPYDNPWIDNIVSKTIQNSIIAQSQMPLQVSDLLIQ